MSPPEAQSLLSVSIVLQTLQDFVLVLSSSHVFLLGAQFWETKPWPAFSTQSTWTKLVCDLPQSLVHGDSESGELPVSVGYRVLNTCQTLWNLTPALSSSSRGLLFLTSGSPLSGPKVCAKALLPSAWASKLRFLETEPMQVGSHRNYLGRPSTSPPKKGSTDAQKIITPPQERRLDSTPAIGMCAISSEGCKSRYFFTEVCSKLPWWLRWLTTATKKSACNAEDLSSIPGSGMSPGEGNEHALQYSCLENSMDRGAWQTTVHRVTESDTTEAANTHICVS